MPTIPYQLPDGTPVRGVTTIIGQNLGRNKEALKYWAWDLGMQGLDYRKSLQESCDAGTITHGLIDADVKGYEYPMPAGVTDDVIERGYNGFWNFTKWKEMVKFKPIVTEISMVVCVERGDPPSKFYFGMTPDCIAEVTGQLAIVDYKTSKGVYGDHRIQISAYSHGWNINFPDKELVGGHHLLQIGKDDASFHHHFWQSLEKEWTVFLALLLIDNLWPDIEGKKRRGARKNV